MLVLATAGVLASPATAAVPRNTSPPTISGTTREGQTLTTSNGTWANTPTSFSYRWQRCAADGTDCTSIAGATNRRYTLVSADVDHTVRVMVTASNADGQSSATSAATEIVSSRDAPVNTSKPTVSGTPQVGEELAASQGTWTGGVRSFAYQWQRCNAVVLTCVDIIGATGQTYGVRSLDVGSRLRVQVEATNRSSSATAASDPTSVVKPLTPPPPPAKNKAPTITLLSAKFVGLRIYIRVRICDDSYKNVNIIARDTKPGVLSYTHRFATLTPPRPCGTYSRSWVPPTRFRTGRYIVTVQASDKSGAKSRIVSKTFFR